MGKITITVAPDFQEVATAIQHIRDNFTYKRNQLAKALGREPYADELLKVCFDELDIMHKLHETLERIEREENPEWSRIPDSLLVSVFLTKVWRTRIT